MKGTKGINLSVILQHLYEIFSYLSYEQIEASRRVIREWLN